MEKLLGSLRVIVLEVTGIFLVAVFEFLVPGTKYHVLSVTAALVLLAATFLSLALYGKRVSRLEQERKREKWERQIDKFVDDLEDRLVEILQTAIVEQWPTTDETTLCQEERKSNEVWVLAGDLSPDLGSRRGTIIDNLSESKRYRYICLHKTEADLDTLWHICERNALDFKREHFEMKCLPDRKFPPLQLLVFRPGGSVHLVLQKAPGTQRVLSVKAENLRRDAATAFNTLWSDLTPLEHHPGEEFIHGPVARPNV